MVTMNLFERTYRAHFSYVYRLARFLGAPDGDAEDVSQEVFVAFDSVLKGPGLRLSDPRPWFRATVYRVTRDYRRTLRRYGTPTELGEGGACNPMDPHLNADVERGVALHEQWAFLLGLLEGLTYERRAVFVLHELEGLTVEQIAADLGLSVNTAASRLRRAREDFEEILQRERAKEQRMNRSSVLLPPLSAEALLRLGQARPSLEPPAGAEDRVWARVQKQIDPSAPRWGRPKPRLPKLPKPSRALSAALAFVVGIVTGSVTHGPSASVPPPPPRAPEPAPILAVAPVEDGYRSASLTPAVSNSATATPYAPTEAEEEIAPERHCLELASVPLHILRADPHEALRLLAQCEQGYPRSRFPEVRQRIRREAQASLDQEKR